MADINELSDDENLLDLLRLIVTRHPGTKSAITTAFKKAPHLANSYLTFQFREGGSMTEYGCRCHYEHEYMTYINENGFDFESFSHVANNVIRGHCRHASNNNDSPRSVVCGSPKFTRYAKNFRRFSVDTETMSNKYKRRLPSTPSSHSLRSLELNENYRGLTGLQSRRPSSSIRSLALEVEDVKGQTQTSLIHAAAAIGDGGLLVFLLKKSKVSLEQIGKFKLSPLHLAIIKHKMCYLKHIILRPEIYLSNRAGMFGYADLKNDKHAHRKGLSVNKSSLVGLCIKLDDLETLSDLLSGGLISDIGLERGLKEAVEEDSADAVEILLQSGARPDLDTVKESTSKSVAVFESIFRPFRKDFKVYTIQHPDYIVRELLMPAILTKNRDVVQVLVQNGAPVSGKGFYTPLTCAVLENQADIVKLLLCYHADKAPEMQGYNLLDLAICMGFTECAEVLMRAGMKKKHRTIKSVVPCNLLLGIARKLDLPQDQVKLQHYLENKRHHSDEGSVLHVAIKTKLSISLVREILRLGSDVNAKTKKLETPLLRAVSNETCSDPEIIREILYYNPILEECDKSGKTTLMHAIARDHAQRTIDNMKHLQSSFTDSPDSIATLLLDCGYNVKFDDLKKTHHTMYALKAVWKDLAATIGCGRDGLYVQHNPKSLKVRSREVMRRSYPGIRLHKFLDFMKVPPEIKEFVLLAQLLKINSCE